MAVAIALCTAMIVVFSGVAQEHGFYTLPSENGSWTAPSDQVGRRPSAPIRLEIAGAGWFEIDPAEVEQTRPDLFRPGHLSIFDLVAHLGASGVIELESRYDEGMATHVIESVNGDGGWWYEAYYAGGWPEPNAVRMDHYPVKDGLVVRLRRLRLSQLELIYRAFAGEVERLERAGGMTYVPQVTVRGPRGTLTFVDVRVTSHDVRPDLWQPGTITALDILLSLGEQGKLAQVGLQWYDSIGRGADPIDNFFVELIRAEGFEASASGGCGFVYEVGYHEFRGFSGNHVHIPTDARIILSPEYGLWFWICL